MKITKKSRALTGAALVLTTVLGAGALTSCSSVSGAVQTGTTAGTKGGSTETAKSNSLLRAAFEHMAEEPATGVQGTIKSDADGTKVDMMIAATGSKEAGSQIKMKVKVDGGGTTLPETGVTIMAPADGKTMYVKVDNLAGTVKSAMSASGSDSSSSAAFDPIIKKIGDKYISMDLAAFEKMGAGAAGQDAPSSACASDIQALQSDKEAIKEVADVFEKANLFTVKQSDGTEDINGEKSQGFELTPNKGSGDGFAEAIQATKLGKALEKCSPGVFDGKDAKSSDSSTSDDEFKNTVVTVYAGVDSKRLNKIAIKGSNDTSSMEAALGLSYDKVTVEEPTDVITLKEAVDTLQPGMYDNMMKSAEGAGASATS